MDRNTVIQIAAILSTLRETHGAAESMLYIGIGMDISRWETLRGLLLGAGFIEISPAHWVTLTPKGVAVAHEVEQACGV